MNLQRYAVILLGMLLWPGWSRGTAAMQDRRVAKVKHYLDSVAGKANIPGFSLGIVDHGKVTVFNYGYASAERKLPVSSQTLFEIGSCTKAFTAVAVEQLIAAGKLRYNDSISTYLPGFVVRFREKPQEITIAQLLHHTSGIPWSSLGNIPASTAEDALRRTVYTCSGSELVSKPGSVYEYATINFDILALIRSSLRCSCTILLLASLLIRACWPRVIR
jgi:putative ATP-binding cassette transporter